MEGGTVERALLVRLVMLPRGARFFARRGGGTAVTLLLLPTFSDEEACRLAKDDVVDDENDERRFWVDILGPIKPPPTSQFLRPRTSSELNQEN